MEAAAIPSCPIREVHTEPVNWGPLLVMIESGTPNLGSQPQTSALEQEIAVTSFRGIASGHLENRSMIVNR